VAAAKSIVKVDIQMLRPSKELRGLLSHDGWALESSLDVNAWRIFHAEGRSRETPGGR
jgi:hypothetical protein